MTKDTKRKSHSKLLPKITNGSSSMSNKLLAERASPWLSLERHAKLISACASPQAAMTRMLAEWSFVRAPTKSQWLRDQHQHNPFDGAPLCDVRHSTAVAFSQPIPAEPSLRIASILDRTKSCESVTRVAREEMKVLKPTT